MSRIRPLFIWFTLFVLFSTGNADRTIPPPLPKAEWERSGLNYTELHSKYATGLVCMTPPVGVYGYYYRIAVFVSMLMGYMMSIAGEGLKGATFPTLNFLGSLFPAGFSIFLLHQQVDALHDCEAYGYGKHLRGVGIANAVFMSFFVAGSLATLFMSPLPIRNKYSFKAKQTAIFTQFFAACLLLMVGNYEYVIIASQLDLGFGTKSLSIPTKPAVAVMVPIWTLLGLYLCLAIYSEVANGFPSFRANCCNFIFGYAFCAAGCALIVFNQVSAIKLGMVMGDPWGGAYLKGGDWTDLADVILMGAVPFVQFCLLVYCKLTGRLEEAIVFADEKGGVYQWGLVLKRNGIRVAMNYNYESVSWS